MTLADPAPAPGPDSALTLSDLCQQNITVLDDAGGLYYKQPDNSCMCGPPAGGHMLHIEQSGLLATPVLDRHIECLWPALCLAYRVSSSNTWQTLALCWFCCFAGEADGDWVSAYVWIVTVPIVASYSVSKPANCLRAKQRALTETLCTRAQRVPEQRHQLRVWRAAGQERTARQLLHVGRSSGRARRGV